MRFSLIEGRRSTAQPKVRGVCPSCMQPTVAKCGTQKIWHWAHESRRDCDSWWEPETEWHRNWKSEFPAEWQEVIQWDGVINEKHIADVKTEHGLIMEFQHSHLGTEERVSREQFYKDLVWVVNGTRLKRDYSRFNKGTYWMRSTVMKGFFLLPQPERCLPVNWMASSVPVVFDFGNLANDGPLASRDGLYCLLPGRVEEFAVIAIIGRENFVETLKARKDLMAHSEIIQLFSDRLRRERAATAIQRNRLYNLPIRRVYPRNRIPRRF